MKTILHTADPFGIDVIVGSFTHDRFFLLSELRFEESLGEVDIRFEKAIGEYETLISKGLLLKQYKVPRYMFHLLVKSAAGVKIEDDDRVDRYDFSDIVFDTASSSIIVNTGASLRISIAVREIDVSILLEPDAIGYETYRSLF